MDVSDLLQPDSVVAELRAATKKQLLQSLSHRAAALTGFGEAHILAALAAREKLGPTGFGLGTAIPHGKIAGLKQMTGLFARLTTPLDYGAIDGLPVDLVFLLLAPEGAGADHLKALARVSRLFRDTLLVSKLRGSTSADALYAMLATGDGLPHLAT